MFSISTALLAINGGALAYWVFGYVLPGLCRRHKRLKHQERERSKSIARKI